MIRRPTASSRIIRAVFFDLYGTLATFDPPREVIQANAAAQFGLALSPEGVDRGYHLADQHMSRQNATAPVRNMSPAEQAHFFARFEQLVLEGAGHSVDLETAAAVWKRVRSQRYKLALFEDVVPALGPHKEFRSAYRVDLERPLHRKRVGRLHGTYRPYRLCNHVGRRRRRKASSRHFSCRAFQGRRQAGGGRPRGGPNRVGHRRRAGRRHRADPHGPVQRAPRVYGPRPGYLHGGA